MAKKRSTVLLLSLASSAVLGGCGSDASSDSTQSGLGKTSDTPMMTSQEQPTPPCATGLCGLPPTAPTETSSMPPTEGQAVGLQIAPPVTSNVAPGTMAVPPDMFPGMMAPPPTAPAEDVVTPSVATSGMATQPPLDFPGLMALPPTDAGAPTPHYIDAGTACNAGECEEADAGDGAVPPNPGSIFGIVVSPPTEGSGGSAEP